MVNLFEVIWLYVFGIQNFLNLETYGVWGSILWSNVLFLQQNLYLHGGG